MPSKHAFLTFCVVALLLHSGCGAAEDAATVPAPDFTGANGWINTDKPISIRDLKGQVVLLDFWTYCCINCMHVFPDLKYLEDKYRDQPVVIIGVHSGKFDEEKDAQNILAAVLRHNITHPVAVDNDYNIWNAYAVQSWPTLILIDPRGNVVGSVSGEGHRDELDQTIQRLLDAGARDGTLGKPMHFHLARQDFKSGELEFPGKVLADAAGHRLFISDTNHHRVLVTTLEGKITDVIGSGIIGLKDGPFNLAQLHQPQGLALAADGGTLYIADTENHAVRAADLRRKTLITLAGTGVQSHNFQPDGPAKTTPLSSPWDLSRVGNQLYVAMAGTHQIWVIDLAARRVKLFAGSGREAATDGPLFNASFAQPSGLASDGQHLYVASSEASSVQSIDLQTGSVSVLAGSGDLFGFGTTDAVGSAARFQHPLGLALSDDARTLFVADTFNNRLRRIDTSTGQVMSITETGDRTGFSEPGGLAVADGALYVADTNHHRIMRIEIARPQRATVLEIRP
jgi:DNA-binding beta-propeller fold protein YncE/cytochrome oxidase Cu insertion factor (SCO1/SenC/PrrC family)